MNNLHNRQIQLLIVSLVVGVTACGDLGGPRAGSVEEPGELLVPRELNAFYGDNLVWTRDGAELVYARSLQTSVFSSGLISVNVSTHQARTLTVLPSFTSFAPEVSGNRIYFGTFLTAAGINDPNFQLQRIDPASGSVESLVTTFLCGNTDIAVSADERFLATCRKLYHLQAGASLNLPPGRPLGFSPDGTRLLYLTDQPTSSTPGATLISTADGTTTPLHAPSDYFILAYRWEGNSPELMSSQNDYINSVVRLYSIDGLTGTRRDIAEFHNARGSFIRASWSPDGRTLGAWIDEGDVRDRTDRTSLYIMRSGRNPVVVATVHANAGRPVFSADGSSVAYVYYHDDDFASVYLRSGI